MRFHRLNERFELPIPYRNCASARHVPDVFRVSRAFRKEPDEPRNVLKQRVGERHAAPRMRRLGSVMNDNAVSCAKQSMRDRRADVATTAHKTVTMEPPPVPLAEYGCLPRPRQ